MLTAFDDYPVHQTPLPVAQPATGDRNFYDRYFFNGYTAEAELYFAAAMGLYPNRGVLDASFSVVRGGVQTSLHTSRLAPVERMETRAGAVRVEVVEPLVRLRLVVDDDGSGVGADLTFTARSAPIEEPRATQYAGTRVTMDSTRLTQFGTWSGWVEVDGDRVEVTPDRVLGSRDRSWGVRTVGEPEPAGPPRPLPQLFWLWAPMQLGDRCLHFDVFEYADGRRWHEFGVSWPDDGPATVMQAVEHDVDWQPGTRRARAARLRLTPAGGAAEEVELEPLLTFQMLGLGYLHPEWGHGLWKGESASAVERWTLADLDPLDPRHIHVQQLCRVRCGGQTGVGVLEQLVIGPHGPSGFRELFDGAPE